MQARAEFAGVSRRQPRNHSREYVLALQCSRCGTLWVGGAGRGLPSYRHPVPTSKMNPEQAERTRAAGCRAWQVPAVLAENAVRDLLVSFRASPAFTTAYSDWCEEIETDLVLSTERETRLIQHARRVAERKDRKLTPAASAPSIYGEMSAIHERMLQLLMSPSDIARQWDAGADERRVIYRHWIARIEIEVRSSQRGGARRLRVYPSIQPQTALSIDVG